MSVKESDHQPMFVHVLNAGEPISVNFGYVVCALSCILFYFNTTIGLLPRIAPESVRKSEQQLWKWRNTANSLIHSFISGTWAIISLWHNPQFKDDLVNVFTNSGFTVLSMSVGYFIYDLIDTARYSTSQSKNPLLLHHVLVLSCFGLAVVTQHYIGYGLVALLVEVNSVFLHTRQLLIIQGFQKDQLLYRVVSYFNIGTFIIFRLLTISWLIQWLVFHHNEIALGVALLGYIIASLMFLLVHSLKMFTKVLLSDGVLCAGNSILAVISTWMLVRILKADSLRIRDVRAE